MAAFAKGQETALFLDGKGSVTEGPGFNVFAVRGGALVTPGCGVLPGITRRTVMDICKEHGIEAAAGELGPDALRGADEAFATSTAGGIMPVTQIDGAPVGDGAVGPITTHIRDTYWAWHRDPRFCQPVTYPPSENSTGEV